MGMICTILISHCTWRGTASERMMRSFFPSVINDGEREVALVMRSGAGFQLIKREDQQPDKLFASPLPCPQPSSVLPAQHLSCMLVLAAVK